MSRRSEQKRARRKKRRAVREEGWVPARVLEQLEIASDLEAFDEQLTERGWDFAEDVDDDAGAAWYWVPSEAEVPDDDEVVNVTVALLTPEEKRTEFFGFYDGFFGKASAVVGPLIFGEVSSRLGQRPAMLVIAIFFILGIILIFRVPDVRAGDPV